MSRGFRLLLDSVGIADEYAFGYAVVDSAPRRFDNARIFALGENDCLPVAASLLQDRI